MVLEFATSYGEPGREVPAFLQFCVYHYLGEFCLGNKEVQLLINKFSLVNVEESTKLKLTYHYPSELFELLVDTIPRLFKGKQSVLSFFWGCGVARTYTVDIETQIASDRDNIYKAQIVRTVLQRLNEDGEEALRERREI